MIIHRIRRITADIDSKNIFNLMYRLYNALKLKPRYLELIPSNSKGWHLIIWTRANGKVKDLRAMLGDDIRRINRDAKRKIGKQTLFDKKRKIRK